MILITGGRGFLGKEVVRSCLNLGSDVKLLVRPGTKEGEFDSFKTEFPNQKIETVEASFNDLDALRNALDGVDRVIHLASSTTGSAAAQVSNTVVGTDNMFKVLVEKKEHIKQIVLCSSLGVLGVNDKEEGSCVDETTPMDDHPEKRDPYTFTKIMQEDLAIKYRDENELPVVILRPAIIFGPSKPVLWSRIGMTLFGVFLHLGGKNRIPVTYVTNCADAFALAANQEGVNGKILHIVDDVQPQSYQVLKRYKKEVQKIRSVYIPRVLFKLLAVFVQWYHKKTDGHLPDVFTLYKVKAMWSDFSYSNKNAKSALGWEPKVGMEDALNIAIEDLKRTN